jgi:hypothetical protein
MLVSFFADRGVFIIRCFRPSLRHGALRINHFRFSFMPVPFGDNLASLLVSFLHR